MAKRLVFTILTVFGIERAFMGPAVQSLAPNLVPERDLANAIAWNSSSWQTASIVGPVAGGLLYGISAVAAYSVALVMLAVAAVLVVLIPKPAQRSGSKTVSWTEILAGFRFIGQEKVVLGAISLDLFAVLLGGAVALMPIFARDILVLGPWGLGLLRAAPGIILIRNAPAERLGDDLRILLTGRRKTGFQGNEHRLEGSAGGSGNCIHGAGAGRGVGSCEV